MIIDDETKDDWEKVVGNGKSIVYLFKTAIIYLINRFIIKSKSILGIVNE